MGGYGELLRGGEEEEWKEGDEEGDIPVEGQAQPVYTTCISHEECVLECVAEHGAHSKKVEHVD